jgi:hypothetical protein
VRNSRTSTCPASRSSATTSYRTGYARTRPAWSPSGWTTYPTPTDEGVAAFFRAWTPAALSTLSFARAYDDVGPNALPVLIEYVRATLLALNIKEILDGCPKLEEIRCWGHVGLSPEGAFFFMSDISQMS